MSRQESFRTGSLEGGKKNVEASHIENTEVGSDIKGEKRERNSTEMEQARELRDTAKKSGAEVVSIAGEGNGRKDHFLEKVRRIGVSSEVAMELLKREAKKLQDISGKREDIKQKHERMVAGILGTALAVGGAGVPGTVKALEMGIDGGGMAQKATKRIAEGVSANSVLVEAMGKMVPGTRGDMKRIGLQVADASGSSAEQLTKRLEAETAALEEQLVENGDENSNPNDTVEGEDDDRRVKTSPDMQFVGEKIPKEREKTSQEEHDELLYGVTVDERFRDQQKSMADLAVDAVKGAAVQAAIAFGEKRGSSRGLLEASNGVINKQEDNTVEVPLYREDIGENGALELQGTLTQGQKRGPLKSKGGAGGDIIYTWEK